MIKFKSALLNKFKVVFADSNKEPYIYEAVDFDFIRRVVVPHLNKEGINAKIYQHCEYGWFLIADYE